MKWIEVLSIGNDVSVRTNCTDIMLIGSQCEWVYGTHLNATTILAATALQIQFVRKDKTNRRPHRPFIYCHTQKPYFGYSEAREREELRTRFCDKGGDLELCTVITVTRHYQA